jgi:ribonuclease P protein component
MLAKTNRLSRALFADYFSRGKRLHSEHFTIVYSPAEVFKVSVVVSKKVAKKAHDRNRLKRQVYGYIAVLSKEQPLCGVFMVFPKPTLVKLAASPRQKAIVSELPRLLITR